MSSPVHVAPAYVGSDHFGSYVRRFSLHFSKRLFLGLEPMTSWSQLCLYMPGGGCKNVIKMKCVLNLEASELWAQTPKLSVSSTLSLLLEAEGVSISSILVRNTRIF
jgi:hypothetical protein